MPSSRRRGMPSAAAMSSRNEAGAGTAKNTGRDAAVQHLGADLVAQLEKERGFDWRDPKYTRWDDNDWTAARASYENDLLADFQRDFAQRQADLQEALMPFVLESQGYQMTTDPATGKTTVTKIADPAKDAAKAQETEIQNLANERTIKGLKGELDIDPSVEADITEGAAQLRAELIRKLGPGAEGSDSWNRAMAEWDKNANQLRYGIRHGQMTTADAIATNRNNTQMRQQGQRYGELQSTTSPYVGTAGVLAGTLNPYFQSMENEKNRKQSDKNAKNAMIGDAIGGFGGGAMALAGLL